MNNGKTHYRKAFKSPYLSSADIVGSTDLTISHVTLSGDASKKSKDVFNTAYFVEKELRQGEELKPMILNATNSKTLYGLTGSHFLEDWKDVRVKIYVQDNVRFGRDTVEGLRIDTRPPEPLVTNENIQEIIGLINQTGSDVNKLLAYCKVSSLEQLNMSKYHTALNMLKKKVAK
jgi:hypothetical protein